MLVHQLWKIKLKSGITALNVLSQLQWWHVANEVREFHKIEEKYIDSQTIILVHEIKNITCI